MLKQLEYFLAVVRHKSFTEAAYEQYISQSAISQQVKQLEAILGVALIVRKNRSFSLTPAGDYVARVAPDILKRLEHMQGEAQRLAQQVRPQLRVGYLNRYQGKALGQALAQVSQLYPDLELVAMSGSHEELYEWLLADRVDIILNDQWRAFSDAFTNDVLGTFQTYAYMSPSMAATIGDGLEGVFAEGRAQEIASRVGCQHTVSDKDLAPYHNILICGPNYEAGELDHMHKALLLHSPYRMARSLSEAQIMAAAGQGYVLAEELEGVPDLMPGLVALALSKGGKPLETTYSLFSKPDLDGRPEIVAFRQFLRENMGLSE